MSRLQYRKISHPLSIPPGFLCAFTLIPHKGVSVTHTGAESPDWLRQVEAYLNEQ